MNSHILWMISTWMLLMGFALCSSISAQSIPSESSLTLKQCLEHAHQANPDLLAVRAATLESAAKTAVAGAQLGPNIAMNAQSKFQSVVPEMNQPDVVMDTPFGPLEIPGRNLKLGDSANHSIDLEISQLIYAGGRLRGAVRLAEQGAEAAELSEAQAVRNLDALVAGLYLNLARLQELRGGAKTTLEQAERHGDEVRNLFSAGAVTKNEVLKAEVRVSEAESALISARHQENLTSEQLKSATGLDFSLPVTLEISTAGKPVLPDLETSIAKAVASRSDVDLLTKQIEISKSESELIHREHFPSVYAFGRASYGKPGLDFIKNEWSDYYVAGIQCSLNIWDNHRISSRESQVAARIETLIRQREALESRIRLEIIKARLAIEEAGKRLDVAQRTRGQSEENFRITADRFKEGTLTNTDYLDADTALFRASTAVVVAQAGLDQAWVDYLFAAGADLSDEEWIQ
jgi:outer membrane protein